MDLMIGNASTSTYTFAGIIDEFRVWNVARSHSEIQSALGDYLNGDESGLVGYWMFNEGSGSVIHDGTASGNNGAIVDARWAQGTTFELPVSVDESWAWGAVPKEFSLRAVYPNPFAPSALVAFDLARSERVKITVFDLSGRRITTLVDEKRDAGTHEVVWAGVDAHGRAVPSGAYLLRMQSGDFSASRRCMLVR
jgi:hypothetical protein